MAQYRFLQDAYINDQFYQKGTMAVTADVPGGTLPAYWQPSGNVEPIDQQAMSVFVSQGPQPPGLIQQQYSNLPTPKVPGVYWLPDGTFKEEPFYTNPQFRDFKYYQDNTIQPQDPNVFPLVPGPGQYIIGAVRLLQGSSMFGNALSFQKFPQGVMSFWARYTPGLSELGSVGFITQRGAQQTTTLTRCQANSNLPNPDNMSGLLPTLPTLTALGPGLSPYMTGVCVTFPPGMTTMNLADYVSTNGLVVANIINSEDTGQVSQVLKWFNMGGINQYYHPPGSTWMGSTPFLPADSFLVIGCDLTYYYLISSDNLSIGPFQNFVPVGLPSLNPPDYPLVPGAVWFQGSPGPDPPFDGNPPSGSYQPASKFPGTVWLAKYQRQYQPAASTGWHHYICSFDLSQIVTDAQGNPCPRVQWAMDGAGGPSGGPLMDTAQTDYAGALSQPMSSWSSQGGVTGNCLSGPKDVWQFTAPYDSYLDLAYCYFAVAPGFFNLTIPGNIDYFYKNGQPQDFTKIKPPLAPLWIHTGGADTFPYNIVTVQTSSGPRNLGLLDPSVWPAVVQGLMTDIDPPIQAGA